MGNTGGFSVDLEEMSKRTGVSVERIKEALAAEPTPKPKVTCQANSAVGAQEDYYRAPTGSDAETAAFMRWLELSTTEDEVGEIIANIASPESPLEDLAIKKFATFFPLYPYPR